MSDVLDQFGRPLRSLRISVTDRCNIRCSYCMPEEDYVWLPRESLLSFEEIATLVRAFTKVGVRKVRLTGGEPLLRRDVHRLIADLFAIEEIDEVAMTTNGVKLAEHAASLHATGPLRLTVSLDTLKRERFIDLTRRDELPAVLSGIDAARAAGFSPLKIDTVLLRGRNDDEIFDLLDYARSIHAEIRFIEYMDVGGATRWRAEDVVSRREILERIADRLGPVESAEKSPSAPADRFRLGSGQIFGVISSTTAPFCAMCDRARLTADGRLFTCLYAREGVDLLSLLRSGAGESSILETIERTWRTRSDRGAEDRLQLKNRGAMASHDQLRSNPHLEMHTRGG